MNSLNGLNDNSFDFKFSLEDSSHFECLDLPNDNLIKPNTIALMFFEGTRSPCSCIGERVCILR